MRYLILLLIALTTTLTAQQAQHTPHMVGRIELDSIPDVDSIALGTAEPGALVLRAYALVDSSLSGVDTVRITMDNGTELARWAVTDSWVPGFITTGTVEASTGTQPRVLRAHFIHSGGPKGTLRILIHWQIIG